MKFGVVLGVIKAVSTVHRLKFFLERDGQNKLLVSPLKAASQRYSVEIETKGEAEINFNNDLITMI